MANVSSRPDVLSTNFQREVQSMLFLYNWQLIDRKEVRENLRHIGMELNEHEFNVPELQPQPIQEPIDDGYPQIEAEEAEGDFPIAEDVMKFIQDNNISIDELTQIPAVAFAELGAFVEALPTYQQESEITTGGAEEGDER